MDTHPPPNRPPRPHSPPRLHTHSKDHKDRYTDTRPHSHNSTHRSEREREESRTQRDERRGREDREYEDAQRRRMYSGGEEREKRYRRSEEERSRERGEEKRMRRDDGNGERYQDSKPRSRYEELSRRTHDRDENDTRRPDQGKYSSDNNPAHSNTATTGQSHKPDTAPPPRRAENEHSKSTHVPFGQGTPQYSSATSQGTPQYGSQSQHTPQYNSSRQSPHMTTSHSMTQPPAPRHTTSQNGPPAPAHRPHSTAHPPANPSYYISGNYRGTNPNPAMRGRGGYRPPYKRPSSTPWIDEGHYTELARINAELQKLYKEEVTCELEMEKTHSVVKFALWEVEKWDNQAKLYKDEVFELDHGIDDSES